MNNAAGGGDSSGKSGDSPAKGPRSMTLGGVRKARFAPTVPQTRVKSTEVEQSDEHGKQPPKDRKNSAGGNKSGRGCGERARERPPRLNTIDMGGPVSGPFSLGPSRDPSLQRRPMPVFGRAGSGGAGDISSPSSSIKSENTSINESLYSSASCTAFESGPAVSLDELHHLKAESYKNGAGNMVKIKQDPSHDDDGSPFDISLNQDAPLSNPGQSFFYYDTESRSCKVSENSLFFVQLPNVLPNVDSSFLSGQLSKMSVSKTMDPGDEHDDTAKKDIKDRTKDALIKEPSVDGQCGKLIVYRSGRTVMQIGDLQFEVVNGSNCMFLQNAAVISTARNQMINLGPVDHRLIVYPDFSKLLQ